MTSLSVYVPDALFGALRKAPDEVALELCVAAAIHWYQLGTLSMERAAETARLDRAGFLAELVRRRIPVFVMDDAEIEREFGA